MSDVAFVHDGAPPQINVVRVDGAHAVLMTIQKAGSASTLDVINGVKALLPKIRASLPPGLEIEAVGDQSAFVQSSVNAVLREGAIAAALTGLMILLFLGSWRSTVIILVSIPLAILGAIAALSATGETINVMTLGGLALAVGILVDDATVTIENINWHLEHGKEIEVAILDGARQIVVPATVSLLCICIVFVPMFGLGGVSGYLFRPMAKAVVFALCFSYLLSRTLVNTLARYLVRRVRPAIISTSILRERRAATIRWCGFSAASSTASRISGAATAMCSSSRWHGAASSSPDFSCVVRGLLRPGAVSRAELLSVDHVRSDQAAYPRADRHADRGDRGALRQGRGFDPRASCRAAWRRSSTISACRSAASIWPTPIPARLALPMLIF